MIIIHCLILSLTAQVGNAQGNQTHPAAWDKTIAQLEAPSGAAFLPDGRAILTERHRHAVSIVNANDNISRPWIEPGILHQPHGIDANEVGVIVVADSGNHLVRFFNPKGELVHTVDGHELSGRRFRTPMDVAISNSGLAVADTGNNRVVVFNRNGTFRWSTDEIADLELNSPEGVDIDESGNVFIADTGNHRVVIIDENGKTKRTWGDWGRFPGLFAEPSGIEHRQGAVYVADRLNHRVQIFDTDGELISWWGMHAVVPRQGEGHIHYPSDVAINASGDRTLVSEPFERRAQTFQPGTPSRPPRSNTRAPRGLQSHFGSQLESGPRGLVTWEPEVRSLPVFITDREIPIHVATFGTPGAGPGRIGKVADISWNPVDDVLTILDTQNHTIQNWKVALPPSEKPSFNLDAAVLLRSSSLPRIEDGSLLHPIAADYDDEGTLHVIDGHCDEIYSIRNGELIPWNIDFDPVAIDAGKATIAVADGRTGQAHLFTNQGQLKASIGPAPDLSSPNPGGIVILRDGSLVISDSGSDRLDHFAEDGRHLETMSSSGGDHGQIWIPGEIVEDANGRIIVLDQGNHRMQGFEPDTGWVLTFGLGRSMTPDRLKRSQQP